MTKQLSKLGTADFQTTSPQNEKLAATTWAKDSLDNFKEQQIIQTLTAIKGIPAKEWYSKYKKGSTDVYISAVQGALKILYKRNPKAYKDPGVIDGVYSNIRNGKPDLKNSNTAKAMREVTGKLGIDDKSIGILIEALEQNNAAELVQEEIEQTGAADPSLSQRRGEVFANYKASTEPASPTESYGASGDIIILNNGKFKAVDSLDIEFDTRRDAIHTQVFIQNLKTNYTGKGANEYPFHIQPGSGDIEFDTAFNSGVSDWKHLGGLLDTEIIDDDTSKLPKKLIQNKQKLVDYLNTLNIWEK